MIATPKNELTGPESAPLREALTTKLSLEEFDQMLTERLDIKRENIALGSNFTEIVRKVIDRANRFGWVYKLVYAARLEQPDNPVFVEYAQKLGIGLRGAARFESVIKASNIPFNIAVLRSHLGTIEGQVCRVDIKGDGEGTGFLIGPGTVLTNYHVIQSIDKKENNISDLTCLFDYKVREDGTEVYKGKRIPVDQLVTLSKYDPADLTDTGQLPDPDNLDYAVLRLQGEPGKQPIAGTAKGDTGGDARGWLKLTETPYAFAPKSPLHIVQHPDKEPMQVWFEPEAIISANTNGTRVKYNTNTKPGSSGSPCFSQNWELVALHHAGDPDWVPTWNAGIPIPLIVQHLKKNKVDPTGEYIG